MIRYDILVAEETLLHRGHSRLLGPGYIGVAEAAVDLLHSRVDPVAERYGLTRPDALLRIGIIQGEHGGKEKPGETYPEIALAYPLRLARGSLFSSAISPSCPHPMHTSSRPRPSRP